MKITFVEDNKSKTAWENIKNGAIFSDGDPIDYFMKIEDIADQRDNIFNAVYLKTGQLTGFMPDCRVKIVDAELVVKER